MSPAVTRPAALAVAFLGELALGACGGTLYDPGRVPAKDAGSSLACTDPTAHACGGACVPQDVSACGASCSPCPGAPANATATCAAGVDGAWACGFACDPGWFACGAACCRATRVAAGGDHSCAILDDGSLACWGANDAGQLGVATATPSSQHPVRPLGPGVTDVALGSRHTCAIQAGDLKCWGANSDGQLGIGSASTGGPTPVTVALAGATKVAAGTYHTCALVAGGAVRCWGWNAFGQLGNGSLLPDYAATPVSSLVLSGATDLASRADTTCALVGSQLRCWGANAAGQVGDPLAPSPQPTPDPAALPTTGGTAPSFLAVGSGHACAGMTAEGLYCWGDDGNGQLGASVVGGTQPSPIPASRIDPGARAIRAIAGAAFTCSGQDALALVCAGANDQGQTGAPPSAAGEGTVTFAGNVLSAAAGLEHACALVDLTPTAGPTPVVKCWGRNAEGQLGRATSPAGAPSPTPEVVGP